MGTPFSGSALKARIVRDLISSQRPLVVLDHGAGTGAGWIDALPEGSPIRLYCYEPSESCLPELRRNVGDRATVLDREAFLRTPLQADVILSFSVLQQCMDADGYFREARARLAPDGRFVVLYDDGFWRLSSLFAPSHSALTAIRQMAMNALAPAYRRLGRWEHYRRRVSEAAFVDLARRTGFVLVEDRFGNIESFKELWKRMAPEHRDDFMQLWMETEDRLDLLRSEVHFAGHRTNLWVACTGRVCILAPAETAV